MAAFIRLEKVNKIYQLGETTVQALRDVDFSIEKGAFMALVGSSGSGKSTLLNLVGCLDEPTNGKVFIDGIDVQTLNENGRSELRNSKLGIIFQSFNLIPVLNVYENVELPLLVNPNVNESERRDRVMTAIRDVDLESFIHHIPDKLSGGQRQRVAIARALVNQPLMFLADEPTANLDSVNAHRIIDLMQELNQKRHVTFLFATHDEKLIGRVTKIARIQDGRIQN